MSEKKEQITAGTIARTISLVLAIVNQCLVHAGKPILPIEDETVSALVAELFVIGAALWSWWKNNSFTQAALKADKLMHRLKDEEGKE